MKRMVRALCALAFVAVAASAVVVNGEPSWTTAPVGGDSTHSLVALATEPSWTIAPADLGA
ncbi:hypothetical protein OG292_17185 [Streptomyces sp. NBC_01511]|uniref:hypothetical protein n=1 Tax=unclassified Streptomyces TaxID=2593676 RepID=UPI00386AE69A